MLLKSTSSIPAPPHLPAPSTAVVGIGLRLRHHESTVNIKQDGCAPKQCLVFRRGGWWWGGGAYYYYYHHDYHYYYYHHHHHHHHHYCYYCCCCSCCLQAFGLCGLTYNFRGASVYKHVVAPRPPPSLPKKADSFKHPLSRLSQQDLRGFPCLCFFQKDAWDQHRGSSPEKTVLQFGNKQRMLREGSDTAWGGRACGWVCRWVDGEVMLSSACQLGCEFLSDSGQEHACWHEHTYHRVQWHVCTREQCKPHPTRQLCLGPCPIMSSPRRDDCRQGCVKTGPCNKSDVAEGMLSTSTDSASIFKRGAAAVQSKRSQRTSGTRLVAG